MLMILQGNRIIRQINYIRSYWKNYYKKIEEFYFILYYFIQLQPDFKCKQSSAKSLKFLTNLALNHLRQHISEFLQLSPKEMILKMIHEAQLSKDDRKKFIPFVNERNHMGSIIKGRQKDKQNFKSTQVFENLKKTTKEYIFDKKYQKMIDKLSRCQQSLEPRQPNYDNEVSQCFRALEKSKFCHSNYLAESNCDEGNTLFVDLNQKLNQNISVLKEEIQKNKASRIQRSNLTKNRSAHSTDSRMKTSNYPSDSLSRLYFKPGKQNQNCKNEDLRRKTFTNSKQRDCFQKRNSNTINRDIFKEISSQSQKMADFTNCGLKYRHLVKAEKKDPWKKWYVNSKIQIFPGEIVDVKKLQKSIYD